MPTATTPHIAFPTNITPALLLAKQSTPKQRCTLGKVEALARKNARSDRVFLELFCNFFLSKRNFHDQKQRSQTSMKMAFSQVIVLLCPINKIGFCWWHEPGRETDLKRQVQTTVAIEHAE